MGRPGSPAAPRTEAPTPGASARPSAHQQMSVLAGHHHLVSDGSAVAPAAQNPTQLSS